MEGLEKLSNGRHPSKDTKQEYVAESAKRKRESYKEGQKQKGEKGD
jgi:hypothetical protein